MLKNILLGGFFLTTVYFGLQAFEANQRVACLESELCAARTAGVASLHSDGGIKENTAKANEPSSGKSPDNSLAEPSSEAVSTQGSTKVSVAPKNNKAKLESAHIPAEVVDWRLNSVAKLVDINEEQRAQLKELFSSTSADPLAQKTGLKEILGEDNYNNYQDARTRARVKIESENREKDILYKARIINLTPKEESILRDVTLKIDQEIENRKSSDGTKPASPYEGLARYLQFEKLKRELIAAELKAQLPKDKYEAYVKADADSASSELEVWHGE